MRPDPVYAPTKCPDCGEGVHVVHFDGIPRAWQCKGEEPPRFWKFVRLFVKYLLLGLGAVSAIALLFSPTIVLGFLHGGWGVLGGVIGEVVVLTALICAYYDSEIPECRYRP